MCSRLCAKLHAGKKVQGCSKNLRQPADEPFEPSKNNEFYNKSDANFMFLPLSAG